MEKVKRRHIVILLVVVLLALGLWKGCGVLANRDLLASVTLYKVEQEVFEQVYPTRGVVEGKTAIRYPLEGMLVQMLVKQGDIVDEKDVLLRYESNGKTKEMFAKQRGIVASINEQYVEMVSLEDLWLKIEVPSRHISQIQVDDEVVFAKGVGRIVKMTHIPTYRNSENYYAVYVSLPKDGVFSLLEEVEVSVKVKSYNAVYKVPLDAVITCNEKEYVVMSSWMDHVLELHNDDVKRVHVVGVEDSFLVVQCEDVLADGVCVFSGVSLSFIQEMLEMYE